MENLELKRYLLGEIGSQYNDKELKDIPEEVYRDLYLKKVYNGDLEGKLTGNLYLDKPWVQYYLDTPVQKINLKDTLYNNYVNANKDHLDEIALYGHLGKDILTHRKVLEKIDKLAEALINMGYGKNTRVGLFLNNSLEEPLFLLALSKIGAVGKFIDYAKDIATIQKTVKTSNFDFLVMEEFLLPLEGIVNEEKLPVIVVDTKNKFEQNNYISFDDVLAKSNGKRITSVPYEDKKPSIIINSSGTTGAPKPIVHTDYSVNMAVFKMLYTDFGMNRNNVVMKIVPPQIGLGLITTLYTNLIVGTKIVLIEGKTPQESVKNTIEFIKNFKEFRKENNLNEDAKLLVFAAPMYFRVLLSDPTIEDLSYIECMLAAGSKMSKDELDKFEHILKSKGCTVKICNGYGQNEMAGAVTLNSNRMNKYGSAGYPTIGTNIRMMNMKTNDLINATEEGVVLEKTDSAFLEYEGMSEATINSTLSFEDEKWFNTHDLGFMDEDGFQFITGRISRVFIRFDMKIAIDGIEEKIKMHPDVLDCAIVPINKGDSEDLTFAYVSVRPDCDKDLNIIVEEIQLSSLPLSDLEMPTYFESLEKIPYMNNGKVNYIELIEKSKAKLPDLDIMKRTLNK